MPAKVGSGGRDRTCDDPVNSRTLLPLSYPRTLVVRFHLQLAAKHRHDFLVANLTSFDGVLNGSERAEPTPASKETKSDPCQKTEAGPQDIGGQRLKHLSTEGYLLQKAR